MTIEASFAKELSGFEDSDYGFLALLGDNENLDPSLLNIEHGIRGVSLRKDDLVLVKFENGFALADLGEKEFWIKLAFRRCWHEVLRRSIVPQAPPSGASSSYLTQDTATMKVSNCQHPPCWWSQREGYRYRGQQTC